MTTHKNYNFVQNQEGLVEEMKTIDEDLGEAIRIHAASMEKLLNVNNINRSEKKRT